MDDRHARGRIAMERRANRERGSREGMRAKELEDRDGEGGRSVDSGVHNWWGPD